MLLLGGPVNGMEREVANGETEVVIMAPSPGNSLPTPWKYVVREIEAEIEPGVVYRRTVLVEQSMPIELATQALAAVVMQRFAEELVRQYMKGGVRVGEPEYSGIIIAK